MPDRRPSTGASSRLDTVHVRKGLPCLGLNDGVWVVEPAQHLATCLRGAQVGEDDDGIALEAPCFGAAKGAADERRLESVVRPTSGVAPAGTRSRDPACLRR